MRKWQKLSTKKIVDNKFTQVSINHYKLPNGHEIPDWYVIGRFDYVLVIAVNSNSEILVERQYRQATDNFVYEFPAGSIDEGETPEQAASRELLEETGYETKSCKLLLKTSPLPGLVECFSYVVYIEVGNQVEKHEDISEEIESKFMSLESITTMIQAGEFFDMGALTSIMAYQNYILKNNK